MADGITDRIYYNYQYAGLTVAVFFLLLAPLLWTSWPHPLLCVFLQLPAYFIHQVEEYYHDRFRLSMNRQLAHGSDALTKGAVLVINIAGVWGTDLLALYLCYFLRPGLGLIAIYLALVNATVHILFTLITRSYNPGLYTALLLLLPGSVSGLVNFARSGSATTADHIWGISIALAIHIMIAIHIYRRVRLVNHPTSLAPLY